MITAPTGARIAHKLPVPKLKKVFAHPAGMREFMSVEAWYVLSSLLAPIGYVVQSPVPRTRACRRGGPVLRRKPRDDAMDA